MSSTLLLRIALAVLLCLNGTTALWASTHMAVGHAHPQAPAEAGAPLHAGPGHGHTAASADSDDGRRHEHSPADACFCGSGAISSCTCQCGFTNGFVSVTVPFIAGHSLRTPPPAYVRIHAPARLTGSIFRPPIG